MAMPADNSAAPLSPVEIFYSYSHKDELLRDELEKHLSILKRQGVISGWHDRRIAAGSEWAGEIDEHLESAQIILLLISSDFLASDYCYDLEMKRALERHEAGEALVIPVILRECDWSGALFAKLQALPKDGRAITSWANRDEAFKDVAVGIRKVVEGFGASAESDAAASVVKRGALPRICNLPHLRNPNFTGRDELLKNLHDSLTSGKAAALTQAMHGLGGVGKTQTAVEYIYRHAAEYEVVWWIRSEEPAKLASDYAALAEPLRLKERGEKDQSVIVQAVRRALVARGRWLIVFDNANGPEDVHDYVPVGGTGHVLVTSRNPAFGGVAHPLKVEKMSEDEAVRFLLKRSGVDESKSPPSFRQEREKKDGAPDFVDLSPAAELAKELGYLPLALEHAGAYIEEKGATIAGYLKIFTSKQKALLAGAKPPEGYPATVLTTWKLSFDEVGKKSETAAQLMNLCAFLAPDDIGREMLRSGAKFLPEPLAMAVANDLQWNDAIGALRKYSLVEVQDGAISVHRLVQMVVRDRLGEEERKRWTEATVRAMNASLPFDADDFRTWEVYARLLPHGLASEGYAEELGVELGSCARILNQLGAYMGERADFFVAQSALERALKIGESAYGPDHPTVAIYANNLGNLFRDQRDLTGAKTYYERALRIGEAAQGTDHPQVASYVNNMGSVLYDQGDFAGARACFERALKIDEAVYGLDHPRVARDMNNLGAILWKQGDLAGARAYLDRVLDVDEMAYGPDHPRVAIRVNNLGNVLEDQGDLAGARACFERALRIWERSLGRDHPKTKLARRNLAGLG